MGFQIDVRGMGFLTTNQKLLEGFLVTDAQISFPCLLRVASEAWLWQLPAYPTSLVGEETLIPHRNSPDWYYQ